MSRAKALAVLVPAALALIAGVATASSTSVTITSPREGQSVSLRRVPNLPVYGSVTFAAATPNTTRFFMRRDGCGTSNDNPHLSVTSGTDGGDGCGLVVSSVAGPGGTVDQGAFVDYPSEDGMPLTVDASRAITGTIDLEDFTVEGAPAGAGQVTVDVSMEALYQGNGVDIGSDSENVLVTPAAQDYPVQFTISPNQILDRKDLSGIDLRVHVEGPYVFSGFIGNSGKSWVDVPSYTASVNRTVLLSLDDPTFASPIPVAINSGYSGWSVVIPTPAVGKHTLYAESVQGFSTSSVVVRHFTVTR